MKGDRVFQSRNCRIEFSLPAVTRTAVPRTLFQASVSLFDTISRRIKITLCMTFFTILQNVMFCLIFPSTSKHQIGNKILHTTKAIFPLNIWWSRIQWALKI